VPLDGAQDRIRQIDGRFQYDPHVSHWLDRFLDHWLEEALEKPPARTRARI
jgi:GMP synthase (glutamine-hydrolysing)